MDLAQIRKKLDEVDRRIVDGLAERIKLVSEVARVKAKDAQRLRDVLREEDLLTKLVAYGRKVGLDSYLLTRIFHEILDHSLRLQERHILEATKPDGNTDSGMVVAYHGTEGSYSHLAATRHFRARTDETVFRGFETFAEILEAVRARVVHYAVLPIENTTAGSINEVYDLLARMNLSLVGEEALRVEHCLVALEKLPLSRIRRIYSHPLAITQCSNFLSDLRHCHIESFADSATAAKKVRSDQDLSQAAIASDEAARLYGLHVVKKGIANQKENFTRYVIVAPDPVAYDLRIPCKTSLLFGTGHDQGSLLACLDVFAKNQLNLTKLESRPRQNVPWEYLFYVDFEGNLADAHVQNAMRLLASKTNFLKIFGSYPARTTRENRPAEPRPAALEVEGSSHLDRAVLGTIEKMPNARVGRSQHPELSAFEIGSVIVGGSRPIIFAGPEDWSSSRELAKTISELRDVGVDVLWLGSRRVRRSASLAPDYRALEEAEQAARSVGMPVMVDVVHPSEVERVCAFADVIRVSPADMQSFPLLEEVGRRDRPVVLSRGPVASVEEWLASAEYVASHGNQRIILCESGVRTAEGASRSIIDVALLPILRQQTHLPIIVEPTGAGNQPWVSAVVDASLAAGAQGILVGRRGQSDPDDSGAVDDETLRQLIDRARRSAPSV